MPKTNLGPQKASNAFRARYLHLKNCYVSKQICGVIGHSLRGWAISVIVSLRPKIVTVCTSRIQMQSLSFLEHFWRAYKQNSARCLGFSLFALIARSLTHIQPPQLKLVSALSLCHCCRHRDLHEQGRPARSEMQTAKTWFAEYSKIIVIPVSTANEKEPVDPQAAGRF